MAFRTTVRERGWAGIKAETPHSRNSHSQHAKPPGKLAEAVWQRIDPETPPKPAGPAWSGPEPGSIVSSFRSRSIKRSARRGNWELVQSRDEPAAFEGSTLFGRILLVTQSPFYGGS
jgi:hypothetical protein